MEVMKTSTCADNSALATMSVMEIALLVFVVVVALASLAWGKDSRVDDVARRRRYLG